MSLRTTAIAPLLVAALCGATTAQEPRTADDEQGFAPLVEGTDPAQFELVGIDSETIAISEDGTVTLTGKPNGYFATRKTYGDYELRFDWKYEGPGGGNSGLLLHIQGEPKVWPKCIEAQLQQMDAGHVFAIQGATFQSDRPDAERKELQGGAILPPGQWNRMAVVCRGDRIACVLNDVEIDAGARAEPAEGKIGWQSEGATIVFRNLRIKGLD